MPGTRTSAIRQAVRTDVDALAKLEEATFAGDRISRRQWRRHIDSDNAGVWVAGSPGHVDAAAVVFYRHASKHARLYSLAVRMERRGEGLASALLAEAERDARRRGCDSVRLEVRVDNAAAIELYEKHGYARTGRLPGFYEDGADAWRYRKPLGPVGT